MLIDPEWGRSNAGGALLARSPGENRGGKDQMRKIMQPLHLMIGKLQYVTFLVLGLILL